MTGPLARSPCRITALACRGRKSSITSAPSPNPGRASSSSAWPQTPPKDAQLIGQFGIGFYASFIVADRVVLFSRRAGAPVEEGVRWESAGEGDYTLELVRKETRGTDVTLHLRPEEDDLLSGSHLREILRKYSDHITFPILMKKEQWEPAKKAQVITDQDEQVNQSSALWARPKSEITEEQYQEFYKHVGHDFEPPLAWTHARVEGRQEFTELFYIPRRAPFDLWDRDERHGVKLYVRRVFVMDAAEQLLPAYLRFVRGIVDSGDLPLNVSREILQQSSDVARIRAASVKRVLGLLEDLAEHQKEKYGTFWTEFGRVLKEGIVDDAANREQIAKLLRFASTRTDSANQTVSLTDYAGRDRAGQDAIYYVTADGFSAAKNSPHLEVFRKNGVEVLLLADRIDEWVVSHLTEFEGKRLHSAAHGSLDVSKLGEASSTVADGLKEDEYKGSADTRPGRTEGPREPCAAHAPAHRFACLFSRPRGGYEPPSRADPPRVGPARAGQQAHPRDQPGSSGRAAAETGIGRGAVRRLEPHPVRPGDARRGRRARGPGHVREALELAHARPGRRRGVAYLDAGQLSAVARGVRLGRATRLAPADRSSRAVGDLQPRPAHAWRTVRRSPAIGLVERPARKQSVGIRRNLDLDHPAGIGGGRVTTRGWTTSCSTSTPAGQQPPCPISPGGYRTAAYLLQGGTIRFMRA